MTGVAVDILPVCSFSRDRWLRRVHDNISLGASRALPLACARNGVQPTDLAGVVNQILTTDRRRCLVSNIDNRSLRKRAKPSDLQGLRHL